MKDKSHLGKGLGALLKNAGNEKARIHDIPLVDIACNPNQPRKIFDDEELMELSESIKIRGILQPIIVRKKNETQYELIAGERRVRASIKAGLENIKAVIIDVLDKEMNEISLVENIQRKNLNAIEEAIAYNTLIENYKYTHEQLSQRLGKNRSSITNILRLLHLPEEIKDNLMNGQLTVGHAKCILSVNNKEQQILLSQMVVNNKLSIRELEKKIQNLLSNKKKEAHTQENKFLIFEKKLAELFKTKVKIVSKEKNGKISIHFNNEQEFQKIYDLFFKNN